MADIKKIKPLAEMVFINEIVTQSMIAEKAASRLEDVSDQIEAWSSIQTILIAAANISKILWPSRKKYLARGKQLRTLLGIDDDNLLSDRKFRYHFEHYDERIEEWFENNKSCVYMDSRIDPFIPNPLSLQQFSHRSYNSATRTLVFRNESIDLSAILTALAEIREKCRVYGFL